MLVSVEYKDGKWKVDEKTAMIYPEFRDVLEDRKLGPQALAYVALGCDNSNDNPNTFEQDYERLNEAKFVLGDMFHVAQDPKVLRAVKKYQKLCDTTYAQGKKQLLRGIAKLNKFLDLTDVTKENKKEYMSDLSQLAKLLIEVEKMNKKKEVKAEKEEKTHSGFRVKADKQLGYSARKYLKKVS